MSYNSRELAILAAKALDSKKAQSIRVLKVQDLTVLADYFVIASGTSTTQVGALADEVDYQLGLADVHPNHVEGYDSKNWILLDYGDVMVHVFVPGSRDFYDLEHLWADGEKVDISAEIDPEPAH